MSSATTMARKLSEQVQTDDEAKAFCAKLCKCEQIGVDPDSGRFIKLKSIELYFIGLGPPPPITEYCSRCLLAYSCFKVGGKSFDFMGIHAVHAIRDAARNMLNNKKLAFLECKKLLT